MIDELEEVEIPFTATDEINITSTNVSKTYCGNCVKRQHCLHGTIQRKDEENIPIKDRPVIMLKDKCSSACECRCRRFYTARNGGLRLLGTIDTSDCMEGFNPELPRDETDDLIDRLNASNKVMM